ncbi:plasmid mobilization relaxosome protein MobC [Campylobacter concisus]|uniref:plasmid mobilization relaxosome protein MobC n=1 Tax=Campylobacter concisus TaxID=199 RepID=UPI0018836D86|nr:plasmid mobilization relaxosome protein MobC [Campylobacter concisus]MBE9829232.1 plasmid mobilization relaxosome protein MobC [Campylobacter concisus]
MKKNERHSIYFTLPDLKKLNELANQRRESKSAVVRKLIHIEKYMQTLKQIEINNEILADFLKEFKHLGKNLNQIAYHLNAHIIKKEEAKSDLEKTMYEFFDAIERLSNKIGKLKIKIDVERTKQPNNKEIKGLQGE